MPLGADDEQATGLPHLVGFSGDLRLVLRQLVGKQLPGVQYLLVVRLGVAGGLGDQLVGKPGLAQVVL